MRRCALAAICAAAIVMTAGCAETDRTMLAERKPDDSRLSSASVGGPGGFGAGPFGPFGGGNPMSGSGQVGGTSGGFGQAVTPPDAGSPGGGIAPTPFSNPNQKPNSTPNPSAPGGPGQPPATATPPPTAPVLPAFKPTAYCQAVKSAAGSMTSMPSVGGGGSDPMSAMQQYSAVFKGFADQWQKAAELAPVELKADTQTIASTYRDIADAMQRFDISAMQNMGSKYSGIAQPYARVVQACATA